ncbi:uncharacterized protein LOC111381556 [Olea europaea var. sylvestris]|uniref:uncharacterized protein LOC111381556 n=1 Tax=Olea europaea var. sylvestris TaxID=158386 RepID=UPI000C1D642B|nr:uncharacterized protein LOC111381556 [Olea europaea var. sylvestris]
MEKAEATLQNQNVAIKILETQMGQLAMALTSRAPGNMSSNTEINPKEQAKAITTRSGVQLPEIHVKRLSVNGETSPPTEEENVEQDEQPKESTPKRSSENLRDKATATVNPYEPPIPFPQRLRKHKMEQQYKIFLEVFKKLQINIPLADALSQTPSYAKKLGLGEAKATTVTLQLADRSLTHPKETIEDVLIKVEKFIFPADFLILDMEEDKDILLILDKPFLATGRALIDVQRGQLILRFGEEQISFNIF